MLSFLERCNRGRTNKPPSKACCLSSDTVSQARALRHFTQSDANRIARRSYQCHIYIAIYLCHYCGLACSRKLALEAPAAPINLCSRFLVSFNYQFSIIFWDEFVGQRNRFACLLLADEEAPTKTFKGAF